MRIASWNLNHWQRTAGPGRWEQVLDVLRSAAIDVALLQETGPPPDHVASHYEPLTGLRAGVDWGTAVVALNGAVTLSPLRWDPVDRNVVSGRFGCTHPGTVAAATVRLGGLTLTAVSVYGRMYAAGNGTKYAPTTMHRIISDLAPVLDDHRSDLPVVVAGDFNCTTQWEIERDRLMDATVFDRLRAHGLVDLLSERFPGRLQLRDCFCFEAGYCRHVRTHRHLNRADSRPFQDDYVFATEALLTVGRAFAFTLDNDAVWSLSDHCVVGAEFESDGIKP